MNFEDMVEIAYNEMGQPRKQRIVIPELSIEITPTRGRWLNVLPFCESINHKSNIILEYLKKEMKGKNVAWFSPNEDDGILIIAKKTKKQDIITLVEKYVTNFVNCSSCNNAISTLTKTDGKYYNYECLTCGFTKCISI